MPVLLALVSALACLGMIRFRVLDVPGPRSSHAQPTPKGGGVGILAAVVLAAAIARAPLGGLGPVLAAALALGGLAWADDLRGYPFTVKLAGQCAAAAVAVLAPGAAPLAHAGPAAPWLALVWIVGVTNAVNFIDGINGLASGCAALAAAALLASGAADPGTATLAMGLAAGIAGFLPFNYPRARLFMGDVGSQPCGYLLAVLALRAPVPWVRPPLLVAAALSPILLDVAVTLLRRARAGDRLTEAHRGHLYQVAVRAGMPAPLVTLVYWMMTGWGIAVVLAGGAPGPPGGLAARAALVALAFVAWGMAVWRLAGRASIGRW